MSIMKDRKLARDNVKRFQRTPDFIKARAMQLYAEYGLEETSRRMGVDRTTINRWRRELGVPSKKLMPVTVKDVDQAMRDAIMIRLDVSNLLLQKTRLLLHMMTEDKKGDELEKLARGVGILVDKFRLEQGEVTARKETVVEDNLTERERIVIMRDIRAEIDRRSRAASVGVTEGTAVDVSEGTEERAVPELPGEAI